MDTNTKRTRNTMENLIPYLITQVYSKPVYLKTGEDKNLLMKTNIPESCIGSEIVIGDGIITVSPDPYLKTKYPLAIMYLDDIQLAGFEETIHITTKTKKLVIIWSTEDNILEVFDLTNNPSLTSADYYIGWSDLSARNFKKADDTQLKSWMMNYNVNNNPIFTSTFGNNPLFFLAWNEKHQPISVIFTSGGQEMIQEFPGDNTAEHNDIKIDGETYYIWGISHPGYAEYDPDDRITINFK